MEIGGPLQAFTGVPRAEQFRQRPGQSSDPSAQHKQQGPAPQTRQIIRNDDIDIETAYQGRRRRFESRDVELSYQAQQAIGIYQEADYAAGPELLPRLDVYV